MSEEAILGYLRSIDDKTTRMETSFGTVTKDQEKRIRSLENSRTAQRVAVATLSIGGTTGAAKVGLVGKITALLGGG